MIPLSDAKLKARARRAPLLTQGQSSSVSLRMRMLMPVVLVVGLCFVDGATAVEFWKRLGPLAGEHSLGAACKSSLQCLLFVGHSHCDWDSRTCSCQPYHVQLNASCLPGR